MSRKKIVAGNWKMNLDKHEAQALAAEILGMLHDEELREKQIVLFPPVIFLSMIVQQVQGEKRVSAGAQNMNENQSGAFTGEVSAPMIRSCGGTHVLIGHSERRLYYHETNESISRKLKAAVDAGLTPVLCIGESLEEREAGNYFDKVSQQLIEGITLLNAADFSTCVLAYEPVWAIGTGLTATPLQAQEMHHFIRSVISKHFDNSIAETCPILYGGSCNEKNAAELFALADVDGGLIGGASLKSRSFINIIKALQ